MNALQHTSQQYGRSRPCEHSCLIRSPSQLNVLLHMLHEYRCSLVCAWSCSFPVPCKKHKGYTLGYFLKERTSILHAMCELTKHLLVLKNCTFEAKHCISTHHKTLNVSTDSSEWHYCMYGLLLGSMNIHNILQQSQKHRFQNDDIREVPNPGPIKFRHSLQYLEPGICKSLDYYCHLTHCCVLFPSLHNIDIQIWYVLRRLYVVECGMVF